MHSPSFARRCNPRGGVRGQRPQAASLILVALAATLAACLASSARAAAPARPPNVLLIVTDDQGYGDLGCHGNRVLRTPHLDRLYAQSIRLTNFHVDPTCSPTRAALLTGRYSARTGVWHTIMGRSLLRRDEVTMADLFAVAGYRTGIFGKWHLGDNYPYRPQDRGFQETLIHGGGAIGNTPDYWGNTYLSPTLCHNGRWEKQSGYCTDVFFAAAMRFIAARRSEPFFVYLPTNVPHAPLQVPDKYSQPYLKDGLQRQLALFYGMIGNFDENLGRLLAQLDELRLSENTIVIFMSDNGSAGGGYNVQMRGAKGSAYDGGHRVPCFIRWPARLKGGFDVPQITAHVDLLPTLLELCAIRPPRNVLFDGRGLTPLLVKVEDWAPRTLFVQSQRIETPQPWTNSAVMTDRFRLVDGRELFEMQSDPGQRVNVAGAQRATVDKLRFAYEEWYKDVSKRFGEYCPIGVGSPKEDPTQLTAHDWHGPNPPWDQTMVAARVQANGFWAIEVERAGRYRVTLRERPAAAGFALPAGTARLKIGDKVETQPIAAGATAVAFEVELRPGATQLQTWLNEASGATRGAYYVEVRRLE